MQKTVSNYLQGENNLPKTFFITLATLRVIKLLTKYHRTKNTGLKLLHTKKNQIVYNLHTKVYTLHLRQLLLLYRKTWSNNVKIQSKISPKAEVCKTEQNSFIKGPI